jgi:hypothetical protein
VLPLPLRPVVPLPEALPVGGQLAEPAPSGQSAEDAVPLLLDVLELLPPDDDPEPTEPEPCELLPDCVPLPLELVPEREPLPPDELPAVWDHPGSNENVSVLIRASAVMNVPLYVIDVSFQFHERGSSRGALHGAMTTQCLCHRCPTV